MTLLQFREHLLDRQAAQAVRARIDGKYLLGLELSKLGVDFSVLSEFRARLVKTGASERLLNLLLAWCQRQGLSRAGIEGTLSQGIRGLGLRQSRYINLAKTHLQQVAIATALNRDRLVACFAHRPRAQTRVSRFAALAS